MISQFLYNKASETDPKADAPAAEKKSGEAKSTELGDAPF
jgi:hypothetical protein